MKTWKQRLIAALCCVVLLVTSLYVTEPQNAEAAEATSTMSITAKDAGFKLVSAGGTGEMNMSYTGVASDYNASGANFLDNTFIANYITFGGGMTAADLLEGLTTFYVATNSILQFKWAARTTAFTPGWSFTMAKGALLPYKTTSGISYMALDKEYTFKFAAGNATYTNIMNISSVDITTWSLPSNDWGIGVNATTTELVLADSNITNYQTAYTPIQEKEEYRGYMTIDGKDMLDLATNGLKVQTVLNANTSTRVLQVNAWGEVRDTLTTGSAIIIREGMPFYYTDTSGTKWRAELDATYIYTCTGSNDGYSHLFSCAKYKANENVYGLKGTQYTTAQQSQTNTEQYINVLFKTSSAISGAQQSQMLNLALVKEYVDIAGYTIADAKNMGIVFRFIPAANCIQLGFATTAVEKLKVGDMIVLKEGMPVVFNSNASSATLDSTYEITVTGNNGTNLTLTMKEIGDDYSLSGNITRGSDNNFATTGYWNVFFNSGVIPEDETFQELFVDADKNVLAEYFSLTGYDSATVLNNGSITMKRYNISALRGLRVVYNVANITFTEGMVMMFKKGLPITYTTTYGTKMTCLDKDYGFVYDADTNKFTYDATLTAESIEKENAEKFEITTAQSTTFYETDAYKMNVAYTSTKEAATTQATLNILKSTGNAGNTADYVDFCGMDSATIDELGISIKLYPSEPCFQIVWGTKALDWITVGDTLLFKEGMPVYYATGDVMILSKTVSYTVNEVTANSFSMVRYAESGSYALATTQFGTGKTDASEATIQIVNAETGASDALNDANTTYATFDTEIISQYIDFCGLTTTQLEACGTWIKAIRNGDTQVLQIHWGTVTTEMAVGDQLIFYEGLPITYKTTEGLTKTVYLDETVIFTVASGNDKNTYVLNYTKPEVIGSWGIDSGAAYIVSQGDTEGYYNNIDLLSSELTDEVTAVRYTLTSDQLAKYVDFVGLDAVTYGFQAIVIIDGDTKVVQLRWGSTTPKVEDGDHIIFKAGLPIQATTTSGQTKKFVLDADYTFTIQKYGNGKNGYRITGVQEIEASATPGDVDADYLLDKNDITLLKKELIDIISVADSNHADANADGKVNSVDLVHALKNWNVDEQEAYTTIYENLSAVKVAAGDTYTATLNQELGTVNYLRLTFDTTENMYGTFYYTYNGKEYQENFYLAKDEVQFEQFLDNYRTNGVLGTTAATSKTLTKISFTNLGDEEATFLLNKVEKADRTFENGDMLYAQNHDIKIGVDLNMGGSLAYYESLKFAPVEYANTSDRTVHIDPLADYSYSSSYSGVIKNVNLINIYDLGRQVQQSFYIDVQDSDYTRGTYNNNTAWPYNPVQAGDKNNNKSQIVDYRKIDTDGDGNIDMIYVKTRAMDWSNPNDVDGGTTTESYMENWYKLSDNLLYVDNAFVDWAGWEDCGSQKSQELPAFYTGQALNYFVAGNDISTRYGNLGSWDGSGQSYHVNEGETSNWYAWVNADADNAFGFGLYIPNADACTAGRCVTSNQYSRYSWLEIGGSLKNRNATDALIFNLGFDYLSADSNWQNCYLFNTSYTAPTKTTVLREYTSYEYTYVLTADRLTGMQSTFDTLDENQTVTNEAMKTW